MFCSSRGKNLFCSVGEVENENDGGVMRMMNGMEGIARNGGHKILDDVVVNALKNLSFEERQQNLNEQHGVHDPFEGPSPDFLAHKLDELETQLNLQLKQKTESSLLWPAPALSSPPGILLARAMDPNFMQNTYMLRVRVLRAEFYNAAKAGTRMIRYFDLKKEVFGPERICKNIGFEDLNSDDVHALKKGFFQCIQGRDSVGHRIFVLFPNMIELIDPKSYPRLFFFYDTFVNQNKYDKGYVFLAFHLGPASTDGLDIQNRIVWMIQAVMGYPDSPSATHICFLPSDRHHITVKAALLLLSPDMRARIKLHIGSQTEWLYDLMSYGINHHLVPIRSSGDIKLRHHQTFIEYRIKLGERCAVDPSFSAIEIPNNDDVLLGKGRSFQQHRGNVRLHFWIEENATCYDSCTNRKERSIVIANVINEVKAIPGARFLIQDRSLLWMEADDITVNEKLTQMFRNFRKKVAASTTTTKTTTTTSRSTNRTPSPLNDTIVWDGVGARKQKHDEKYVSLSIKRRRLPTFAGHPFYETNEDE